MSKTLTEQWREGELHFGFYYVKFPNEEPQIYSSEYLKSFTVVKDAGRIDILEPVPSYDEYQDILQQNVNQESAIETYIEQIKELEEQLAEVSKKVERLQEQLKEANEIIANFRTYDFTRDDELAEEYQVKYGIAGEKIYTNRKPPKEFERWRKKITKSFENKLKSGV